MVIRWLNRHQRLHKTIAYTVFTFLTLSIMSVVGLVTATWVFSYQLPSPDHLNDRNLPQTTKIFDRNGQLLYETYGSQKRTLILLKDLPPTLIHATLAAEDLNFYTHGGVDPRGLINAVYQNVVLGHTIGGSTITQQLVKNTLLTNRRTLTRKIQEAILAVQIERHYSKDQILQMYLNEVPYGGQVYGVEAAAQTFFGLPAAKLDLAQSALIAGLPQSPTDYSPFDHPDAARDRQHYVLHLMQKAGLITAVEEQQAKEEPLQFASPQNILRAPWFTLWVKDQLVKEYGSQMVEEGGLRITTTLDSTKQEIAEQEIGYQLDRLAQSNAQASQGALVSLDPQTGQILAMVGSRDYFAANGGQVNGTLALRQPGSSIKPFVYLTALIQRQISPATLLNDTLTTFPSPPGQPPYTPQESDSKYWGPLLAHDALANSRNIPTVQVMQKIGVPALISTAQKAGITNYTDPSQYGLSLALGAGEVKMLDLADAYATLATGGIHRSPVAILRVETADGKVLKQTTPDSGQQVFDPQSVFQITNILSDNVARQRLFGPGNLLELPNRLAAVKTGTTNDNKDAWTAGYTPNLVTVVWVGNFDSTPMNGIMGATGATPIWHYFMDRALKGTPAQPFTQPSGLVSMPIDPTGHYACNIPAYRLEFFLPGTEPTKECTQIISPFNPQATSSANPFSEDFQKFIKDLQQRLKHQQNRD